VSAATILNVSFMLKEAGMSGSNGVDEQVWSIIILWVAFGIYNAAQFMEQNAVFGAV